MDSASIIIAGSAGILTFDTAGSLVARRFGFRYGRLAPISYFAYALIGLTAALSVSPSAAALTSGAVGLVEATAGWAISWYIGPGKPKKAVTPAQLALTVGFVALSAAATGWLVGQAFR
jgi:hypothetical protein